MENDLTFLVLGATGMVGTAVEYICNKRNIRCITLGHQEIEMTSRKEVVLSIRKYNPDVVINCVAMASIDPCEKDPESAIELHCNAVICLAKECAEHDIIIVQPSSHAVFDGLKESPYLEDDLVKATSVYSATKLLSERIVTAYCPKHYIIRFPTLFGPRRNNNKGFVDKVIQWIKEGKAMRIADDKMDSPTYSIDAADAMISLILEGEMFGTYHIANKGWMSYYDFVRKLLNLMEAENIIHPARDSEFSSICYKPLRTALESKKIKPLRKIEEALEEYIKNIN